MQATDERAAVVTRDVDVYVFRQRAEPYAALCGPNGEYPTMIPAGTGFAFSVFSEIDGVPKVTGQIMERPVSRVEISEAAFASAYALAKAEVPHPTQGEIGAAIERGGPQAGEALLEERRERFEPIESAYRDAVKTKLTAALADLTEED